MKFVFIIKARGAAVASRLCRKHIVSVQSDYRDCGISMLVAS